MCIEEMSKPTMKKPMSTIRVLHCRVDFCNSTIRRIPVKKPCFKRNRANMYYLFSFGLLIKDHSIITI